MDNSGLPVIGFNRVELVVAEDEIERAVAQFNEALGLRLPRPHRIEEAPVLSSTDFDRNLELVAPVDGQGPFGEKLRAHGAGQIGPLVWEISDVETARQWLEERGYRIRYEYDSRRGNAQEAEAAVHQLVLDPAQWFGFSVTLMQRFGRPATAPTGRLAGKVAIVTGAARGIGAATARLMVTEGASVVLGDIDADGVHALAEEFGDRAVAQRADVTVEADIAALVQTAKERFGRLDVLHNNAVATTPLDTDATGTSDEVWLATFGVVVMAAVHGCRHAIPVMSETGGGSIVNTSSGAARTSAGSRIAYGSCKAALETFTNYVANLHGAAGVRCNAVAPGFVLTEGTRELFDDQRLSQFAQSAAAGRVCSPDEVAEVVVYLASDDARYVSGQVVAVNGGGTRLGGW